MPKPTLIDTDDGWGKPWKIAFYKSWWVGVRLVFDVRAGLELLLRNDMVDETWNDTLNHLAYPEVPSWIDHPNWRISNETYEHVKKTKETGGDLTTGSLHVK